jgi:2-hydroxychromene-2-carboxylate isomerase
MPMTFTIDPAQRTVRTVASGLVTYDDLARHLDEEELGDAVGLAEVIDGRGATTDVTPDQVRALVARTDALLRKGRFGALAIVTDSDFAFGMARMYQILAEPLPVQIGVFRTLGEATAWLSAVMEPVSD